MTKKNYHCPRCGGVDIYELDDSFNCFNCKLEFEKKDCDEFNDENILSVEEKMTFFDAFYKEE
ncbi:MAG: hypothetical protein KGD63_14220 [Candidatus Lokiarchaeota archaeon]|nr:hypothetical protein [Candidatus Lokiarchaeota archaeon]